MRVAMVSEHASPLAVLGGVNAGGQNVHVASLGTAMADHGVDVLIHTRWDDPDLPRRLGCGEAPTPGRQGHEPGAPNGCRGDDRPAGGPPRRDLRRRGR